ncbi:tetratricopeptide repeat protein [Paracoccus sp. 1_MG-2023]|nr:tetratricopeptide repeat protein [Paracoccus sp. 1_MG-2023]
MQSFLADDFTASERQARALTQTAGDAPEGWYLLGMSLANLDRREEAVEAMDRAAALYRRNAAPLVVKGDLLLSLDRHDEAGKAWEQAIRVDPTNHDAHERLAALLESRGDRAGALEHYERAIAETDVDHLAPRLQAARLHLLMKEPARVETLLEDIANPEDAPSRVLDYLARAKVGLGKTDEGAALFDRLIARAESTRPFLARARLAVADQDPAKADATLSEARQHFPDDPALLLEHGRLLGAMGRYDRALAAFDEGLALAPGNPALLRAASLAASRLGHLAPALEHARIIAELPDATTEDRIRLASLLERTGDPAKAVSIYRKILEEDARNWLVLNNLASLLAEDAPEEALALSERAVALAPDVPTLQDTLGLAQLHAGQTDRAARTFETLRDREPSAALPAYRLGVVRLAQGMPEEGRSLLQEALMLEPDFTYAGDARARLQ